jgi:hypothetical protein
MKFSIQIKMAYRKTDTAVIFSQTKAIHMAATTT